MTWDGHEMLYDQLVTVQASSADSGPAEILTFVLFFAILYSLF